MLNKTSKLVLATMLALPLSGLTFAAEKTTTPAVAIAKDSKSGIPDFASIKDVRQKKQAFADFMLPMIHKANAEILVQRKRIESLADNSALTDTDKQWLTKMADDFGMKEPADFSKGFFEQLLVRVDALPVSLVLAQSANESAWGTSRFAKLGNNFFGQWCFTKGCGIVPSKRSSGEVHEVRSFVSPQNSVSSYMHNLNSNSNYQKLRELRHQLVAKKETISGSVLAEGLLSYSARGAEYVKELRAMISFNKWARHDNNPV